MSDLYRKILSRNGYSLQEASEGEYEIKLKEGGNKSLRIYFVFSIVLTIIGLLIIVLGSWIGFIFLFTSVPLYLKTRGNKQIQEAISSRTMLFKPGQIKIKETNKTDLIIPIDLITKFNCFLDKRKDLSVAGIELELEGKKDLLLIEIYGSDKRYLEDDLEKISDFITSILNK